MPLNWRCNGAALGRNRQANRVKKTRVGLQYTFNFIVNKKGPRPTFLGHRSLLAKMSEDLQGVCSQIVVFGHFDRKNYELGHLAGNAGKLVFPQRAGIHSQVLKSLINAINLAVRG